MTLSELDNTLPNGLHDAYLLGLTVSFADRTASLFFKLLVGETDEAARYERAEIRLTGLVAFVVEGLACRFIQGAPLGICSFDTTENHYPGLLRFSEEDRRLFHSLYVEEPWNSFMHLAAEEAVVVWESANR